MKLGKRLAPAVAIVVSISVIKISAIKGARSFVVLAFAIILFGTTMAPAYSVLTHEQVIDLLWKDRIEPMLRKRFPQATDEDLRKAHAFAYGGSLLQDMGYYPFGNKFFSDLVHYVRTGDFVMALMQDSSDLNEYAFSLGALAHYVSDNSGHPTINQVVAIEFPKLRKKFGNEVTYADDPKAHIRTEFGFDMVQVAKNRYTSDRYHDFIGFEVAKPLLERAFFETYALKLSDVFGDEDLSIGTFRRSVSNIIPEMTRVALLSRKDQMIKEDPNFDRKKFLYYLSRTDYQKEWGKGYRQPGVRQRILAWILRIMPKIGPFRALQFKIPTTQTEDMYIKSVNQTVEDFQTTLRQADREALHLENRDCDTGKETSPGEYRLSDKTYAELLDELAEHHFDQVSPDLRANILSYYADPRAQSLSRKDKKGKDKYKVDWAKVEKQIEQLKAYSASVASK
jgi:zinc dependent phospholipase C